MQQTDLTNFEQTKEDEGKVKFRTHDGQIFKLYCTDPYGFWYIKPIKGMTPEKLSGSYTSLNQAERALEGYMKSLKQIEKAIKIEENIINPEVVFTPSVDVKEQEIDSGKRRTQRTDGQRPTRT